MYRPDVEGISPNLLNIHPWKYIWMEREES
jgi:hypothetical protein